MSATSGSESTSRSVVDVFSIEEIVFEVIDTLKEMILGTVAIV